jgi:hypothetical protein
MLSPAELVLNRIAQEHLPFSNGVKWFAELDEAGQQNALALIHLYVQQAHPSTSALERALATAPLKPTATPLILLRSHPLGTGLRKVVQLPAYERYNAFTVLLHLFKLADTERREVYCKGTCTHEWHHLS